MNRVPHGVTFRAIAPGDMPFLFRVYASTRMEELALTGWSEQQKESFLQMQFEAQHTYYQDRYNGASFQIILLNDEPVGRLYVARWADQIRLMDIAVLPAYRNQGLGTQVLEGIFAEARQAELPVTIHVEQFNPALRLYERLGFRRKGEFGVYYLLKWQPTTTVLSDTQQVA